MVRWLAAEGAERIVLAGRRGEDAPGAAELAAELAGSGAEVLPVACDVTDRPALDRLRDELAASGPPVRTVVHAAAHIALAPLAGCSLDEFARVIEAKAAGARNLDEVFDDSVDEFVLFSSIAGVWGSGDHGAYAAANAYLDALAENRRARGLPGHVGGLGRLEHAQRARPGQQA
ncbi:ketoreductase domain-containing protein [Actinomadura madurae]|uniref:ketoreductase domain-containing protein n=1 Tax=Actinomadura madurae TaxID=1993 RepID=UPI0020D21B2F|nr:ketoreductase domain-containing protein [Actinomadura madurae]MCP9955753.1 ketoreductase domain-containing protein [Actinomadura madurae]